MTLEPFFRALPLALPVLGLSVVLAMIIGGRIARRWNVRRAVATSYLMTVGAFLAVTATPSGSALEGYSTGSRRPMALELVLPAASRFAGPTSDSLNLLAGLVLGLASAAVWRAGHRWAVVPAVLLPPAVEILQWLVPGMGRIAFMLSDVVVNWAGVALGMAFAVLLRAMWDRLALAVAGG